MARPNEEVVAKIKALFRLGDRERNSNEGEVLAAMAAARRLMEKHNIAMAEVLEAQDEEQRKTNFKLGQAEMPGKRQHFALHDNILMSAVDLLCGTKAIIHRRREWNGRASVKCVFFGDEADVAFAAVLFPALLSDVHRMARAALGPGWTPSHRSYAEGFATTCLRRAEQEQANRDALTQKEATSFAIVLATKTNWLEAAVKEAVPDLRPGRGATSRRGMDYDAYDQGRRDGHKADFGRNRIGHNPSQAKGELK